MATTNIPAKCASALRNPGGLERLTDAQIRDEVIRLTRSPMGPYLRLFPANFKFSRGKDQLQPARGGWADDNLLTNDPDAVAALWDRHKGAAVATRCDHLFVIDIDRLSGPDGARSMDNPWLTSLTNKQQDALAMGLLSITPSGGRHIYFRRPDNAEELRLAPQIGWQDGVDILTGSKKVVMLPPSFVQRIEKGYCGRYQWADDERSLNLPELPVVLIQLMAQESQVVSNPVECSSQDTALAPTSDMIPSGKRHDYLRDRARLFRGRGLEAHEIIGALRATAATKCSALPIPIPDSEIVELAVSAAKKFNPDGKPADSGLVVMTSTEFKTIPPPSFVIEQVMPAGLTIAFAKPGVGKSFFCLAVGSAVARGLPLFGHGAFGVSQSGTVLFALPEGAASWAGRLRAYDSHHGYEDSPQMLFIRDGVNLFDTNSWNRLLAAIDALTARGCFPALVVVDTLAAATPGANENAGEDIGLVMGRLQSLVSRGSSVLVAHHSNKAGDYRGHSAIAGSCDALLHLTLAPLSRVIELTSNKLRDAESIAPCSFEILTTEFGPVPAWSDEAGPWAKLLNACADHPGLLESLQSHGLDTPSAAPKPSETPSFGDGVTPRQLQATWNTHTPPIDAAHRERRRRTLIRVCRDLVKTEILRVRKGSLQAKESIALDAVLYRDATQ